MGEVAMAQGLADVPMERLEAELVAGAARSAASMYRWLQLVAEFDRREGASSWGLASTAHWVAWKCAVGPRAARDQVSVARRLTRLPAISAAMASGELSYAKVRAICRVATPALEEALLEAARVYTSPQLEVVCRKYRMLDDTGSPEESPGPEEPSDVRPVWGDDGRMRIGGSFSALDGAQIETYLRARADKMWEADYEASRSGGSIEPSPHEQCNNGSTEPPSGPRQRSQGERMAASLVEFAQERLAQMRGGRSSDAFLVNVHVELETLLGRSDSPGYIEGGPPLTGEQLATLLQDQPMALFVKDSKGNPLFVGRSTKEMNRYFRRALRVRDHGRCRFPGCRNSLRIHGHHALWWVREQGPTDIWNIVSLCPRHHRLVHSGKFTVTTDGQGGFRFFRSADGAELTPSPAFPAVTDAETDDAAPAELASGLGEAMTPYALDTTVADLLDRRQREAG